MLGGIFSFFATIIDIILTIFILIAVILLIIYIADGEAKKAIVKIIVCMVICVPLALIGELDWVHVAFPLIIMMLSIKEDNKSNERKSADNNSNKSMGDVSENWRKSNESIGDSYGDASGNWRRRK